MKELLDPSWILFCATLVFIMQVGFLCLESGLVRPKNNINVAVKNMMDFCLSGVIFWFIGYGLMFGESDSGWIGKSDFLFRRTDSAWLVSFFIFQLMFCGTATTIVSGAVAERMRFSAYLVSAALISGLIYPVTGHWIWSGVERGIPHGWLAQRGFIDFAGSTAVHSVGGWMALAAVLVIGPRLDRFGSNGREIRGNNIPMAAMGTLILWFGWFGFNGGSTFELNDKVPGTPVLPLCSEDWPQWWLLV